MAFGTYPTSKSKVFYIFIIDNLEKTGFGSEPEQYRAMLKKTGKPGHDRALGVSEITSNSVHTSMAPKGL